MRTTFDLGSHATELDRLTNVATVRAAGDLIREACANSAKEDATSAGAIASVAIILMCRKNLNFNAAEFLARLKPDLPPVLNRAALEVVRELIAAKAAEFFAWVAAGGSERLRNLVIASVANQWRLAAANEEVGVEFLLVPLLRSFAKAGKVRPKKPHS